MLNNLDDLQIFERVVYHGSFTAAATELGVSKASVSSRVARLEQRLGVRLLQRTTRSVNPTETGRTYAERCKQILGEIREADRAAASRAPEPHGTLRITCPRLFGTTFLSPVLADYLHAHPAVRADVMLTERFVDLIEEGFDLAIRVGHLPSSSLVARKLGTAASARVCAPEGSEATIGVGPRRGDERVAADSLEMARDLAIAGLGTAVVPRFLCQGALEDGHLIEIGPPGPSFPISVVYPGRRFLAARVRRFVDLLVERTEQDPWA